MGWVLGKRNRGQPCTVCGGAVKRANLPIDSDGYELHAFEWCPDCKVAWSLAEPGVDWKVTGPDGSRRAKRM